MENVTRVPQLPLAIEFEHLRKTLEKAAKAEATQQEPSTPISIAAQGKDPLKPIIDTKAVLDTTSDYNVISQRTCHTLRIPVKSFIRLGDGNASLSFHILDETIQAEKRVLMKCSSGTLDPSVKEVEFLVPSGKEFTPDIILGRTFAREYLMLHQHCLTRLKFWASDISDKHIAREISAGHVLQVLDDSDLRKSRQLVEEIRGVFNIILNLVGRKHKAYPAFEVLSSDDVVPDGAEDTELPCQFLKLTALVTPILEIYSSAMDDHKDQRGNVLLCLDGGGIRSFSSLLILEALMREIEQLSLFKAPWDEDLATPEFPRPRDYFDFIFGTSSGGLLAIMLGRLRMNVHDSKMAFTKYSADVFDHPRLFSWRGLFVWPREKYGTKIIDAAIKECVKEREPDHSRPWKQDTFASPDDPCKTGVLAVQSSEKFEKVFMFRTYENINNLTNRGPAHSVPIWKVARATMAAPTYFEPVTIDLFQGSQFLDGGLGTNNPSFHGFIEVNNMYQGNDPESTKQRNKSTQKPVVDVLVSIGTGSRKKLSRFGKKGTFTQLFNLVKYLQALATDAEETHQKTVMLCRQSQPQTQYFRFNVVDGLEDIELDRRRGLPHLLHRGQTKKLLREIQDATRRYLETEEVSNQVRECARAVMNARRFRAPQPISPLPDFKHNDPKLEKPLPPQSNPATNLDVNAGKAKRNEGLLSIPARSTAEGSSF